MESRGGGLASPILRRSKSVEIDQTGGGPAGRPCSTNSTRPPPPVPNEITKRSDGSIMDEILFDSIGIHFNIWVFIHQLLAHLLLVAIPMATNIRSQSSAPAWTLDVILRDYAYPLLFYIMLISYSFLGAKNSTLFAETLWIPLIFFVQHKVTVAQKYASLSETEYERFMNCKDHKLAVRYQTQMELRTGWYNRDPDVLAFELGAAAARVGVRINRLLLHIPYKAKNLYEQNQLVFWNALLRVHSVLDLSQPPAQELHYQDTDGSYSVSVYHLCEALIRRVDDFTEWDRISFVLVRCMPYCLLALPLFSLLWSKNDIELTIWLGTYLISSTAITHRFGPVIFAFFNTAIFDAYRQYCIMFSLHDVMRISDLCLSANVQLGGRSAAAAAFGGGSQLRKRQDEIAYMNRNAVRSVIEHESKQSLRRQTKGQQQQQLGRWTYENISFSGAAAGAGVDFLPEEEEEAKESGSVSEVSAVTTSPIYTKFSHDNSDNFAVSLSDTTAGAVVLGAGFLSAAAASAAVPAGGASIDGPDRGGGGGGTQWMRGVDLEMQMQRQTSVTAAVNEDRAKRPCAPVEDTIFAEETGKNMGQNTGDGCRKRAESRLSVTEEQPPLQDGDCSKLPRIYPDHPQNVIAWCHARILMQEFGRRFRTRIELYVGGTIMLTLLLMLVSLGVLFRAPVSSRSIAFYRSGFLQILLLVSVIFLFLLVLSFLGSKVNKELCSHSQLVAQHMLRLRRKITFCHLKRQELDHLLEKEKEKNDRQKNEIVDAQEETLTAQVGSTKTSRERISVAAMEEKQQQQQQHHHHQQQQQQDEEMRENRANRENEEVWIRGERRKEEKKKAQKNKEDSLEERKKALEQEQELLELMAENFAEVRDILESKTEVNPFTIFNFRAMDSLTGTILTTAISFYSLIINLVVYNQLSDSV